MQETSNQRAQYLNKIHHLHNKFHPQFNTTMLFFLVQQTKLKDGHWKVIMFEGFRGLVNLLKTEILSWQSVCFFDLYL